MSPKKKENRDELTSKCAESYFSRKITWRNLCLILFNLWCVSYCCHSHHHLWLSTPFQSLLKQWLLLLFLQFHIFSIFLRSMFFQVGPIEREPEPESSPSPVCYLKSQQTKCFSLSFSWNFTFFKIEKESNGFQHLMSLTKESYVTFLIFYLCFWLVTAHYPPHQRSTRNDLVVPEKN